MAKEFIELQQTIARLKQEHATAVPETQKKIKEYEKQIIEVNVQIRREKYIEELQAMKKLNKSQA